MIPAPAFRATPPSLHQVVFEIVFAAFGITGMEKHLSAGARILAGAAGHREGGVSGVKERAFDGDLAIFQRQRPETFPCLADHGADAPTVVVTDLLLVCFII